MKKADKKLEVPELVALFLKEANGIQEPKRLLEIILSETELAKSKPFVTGKKYKPNKHGIIVPDHLLPKPK